MIPPRLARLRSALLIMSLATLAYLNALPNAFVLDDRTLILENRVLRQRDGLQKIFTTGVMAFAGIHSNFYRPLMHATWYFCWPIFRENPAGYRALNILLHAAVSVLVLFWLRRIQPNETVAWLAALLFAVHPIHVEAAGWISALPDLQCTLFFLLGFWLYLRAEGPGEGMNPRLRRALETGVAACVLLGLMAKETGFVLPLLLVLYELLVRRQRPIALLRSRLFVYAGIGAAFAVYLAMRWHALGGLIPVGSRFQISPDKMAAGWLALLYEYTARIVWPATLSSFHLIPVPGSVFDAKVLAGLATAAGLGTLAVWLYRRHRPEGLAVLLYVVALAPSFPVTLWETGYWMMGERYLYLPSAGFCWLLAVALHRISAWTGWKPVAAVTLALLGAYGARTVLRNQDWRDEVSFYLGELQTEARSPLLRSLLAEAYLRRGMARQAEEHARAALRLAPRDPKAHNSLGYVYSMLREEEKALLEFQLAAKLALEKGEPAFAARALNNIGAAYSNQGRLDLAVPVYQEALRLDREFADCHNNLGLALFLSGNVEQALVHLRAAIGLNPALSSAHANLGMALATRRDLPAARAALAEALHLDPNNAETLARMGAVHLLAGENEAARLSFTRALSLDPTNQRAAVGMAHLQARGQR